MTDRIGRNEYCPCGSGKKYKRCCLDKDPPRTISRLEDEPPVSGISKSGPGAFSLQSLLEEHRPPRPRTEWDDWRDRFDASQTVERLDMLRALLAEGRPLNFYEDFDFPGVVLDAAPEPDEASHNDYVAFLEELCTSHTEHFDLASEWFVRLLAYSFLRTGRRDEIPGLINHLLANNVSKPGSPAFDLVDLLRLANLSDEAQRFTFAMFKWTHRAEYMSWAVEELLEYSGYHLYQKAVQAGGTPESLVDLRAQMCQFYCDPDEDKLCAMVAHRCGNVEQPIALGDLLGHSEPAAFNLYLLSLDFGRWLSTNRGMPPLVADTLRCFVFWCLVEMREESDRNPLAIQHKRLEQYLAGFLSFMSLKRLRGVATAMGMRHFCDFLISHNLIDKGRHRTTSRMIEALSEKVERALGSMAADYAFLGEYDLTPV